MDKKKRLYTDVCVVAVNVLLEWNKYSKWLLIAVLSLAEEDSSQINKLSNSEFFTVILFCFKLRCDFVQTEPVMVK